MKKIIIKSVVLVCLFFCTLVLVNRMNNSGIQELSAEMEQATLPVVYVQYSDQLINCLHGYVTEMDISAMRDAITPIDSSRTLTFWMDQNHTIFDSYTYEVRTAQGSLVEDGEIEDITDEDGYTKIHVSIRMDLKESEEYYFILKTSKENGDVVRYYTRILYETDCHTTELLGFVMNFHEAIFNKEEAGDIAKSIEPDETGNNTSFAHINIHSSFDTITWGTLNPMRITQAIPTLKEMNGDFCVFEIQYVIAAGDESKTNYYNVTEDYKVRYVDAETIYLLDYDRYQEETFNPKSVNTTKNWFKIGITDIDDFQYATSDNEKRVAFVREGQLWYYDYAKTTITRVFGFWQDDYMDVVTTYNQHDITILTMDDQGNINFAVSGYMNRGEHEGQSGIGVYTYHAADNKIEEKAFIELDEPYEILKAYTSKLMYLNDNNIFFFMLEDVIYRVDINAGEISQLAYGVDKELVAVSDNRNMIAYPNAANPEETTVITMMNLDTEEKVELEAGENECFEAMGFVDNDLVYGIAWLSDIVYNADGSVLFPMHTVNIVSQDREVLKQYEKNGIYIVASRAEDNVVYFDRVVREGAGYKETTQDFITYKEPETASKITMTYKYSNDSLNLLYMVFPDYIYVKTVPKLIMTKQNITEAVHLQLDIENKTRQFFVYDNGMLKDIYSNSGEAVAAAYDLSGVVVDSKGCEIWRKGTLLEYNTVTDAITIPEPVAVEDSLAACLEMLLNFEGVSIDMQSIKQQNLTAPEDVVSYYLDGTGVNLSGCPLDAALYYVSNSKPVITRFSDGTYVLLTSYNQINVRYVNPVTGEAVQMDRTEFANQIQAAGSVWITDCK